MTRRKTTKPSPKREGALLIELQRDYGYALCNLSRAADRVGMMFRPRPGHGMPPKTLTAVRYVKLAVPWDSSLGRALAAADKRPQPARAERTKTRAAAR